MWSSFRGVDAQGRAWRSAGRRGRHVVRSRFGRSFQSSRPGGFCGSPGAIISLCCLLLGLSDQIYLTGEAVRVALLLRICFNILPFNAAVAVHAQGAIELVIMSVAIRIIAKNIEICGRERRSACLADKAGPVIASGELAVLGTDRLSFNYFSTTSAVAFVGSRRSLRRRWARLSWGCGSYSQITRMCRTREERLLRRSNRRGTTTLNCWVCTHVWCEQRRFAS